MSLSKLSEKCKNCPKVDTCDEKRKEACACLTPSANLVMPQFAKGGFPTADGKLFFSPNNDVEIIGTIGRSVTHHMSVEITEEIRKAVERGMLEAISNVKAN